MSSIFLFISCLGDKEDSHLDLEAPQIKANDNLPKILPNHFFETTNDDQEIPLAFTIEDDSGIQEIKIESHSGFDGHTHGKGISKKSLSARGIEMSKKSSSFKLFSYYERIQNEEIQNSKRFVRSNEEGKNIYLDERNAEIEQNDLILAGPYHFSIQATDIEGNQTKYQDNSIYHATIYIKRPYAPQIEVSSLDGSNEIFSGLVYRNMAHSESSDLSFLWIYIEVPNTDNPGQQGTILREWIWGKSNWPHQFRPDEGQPLPDTKQLDLGILLENNLDFYSNLSGNRLTIWAEDTIGNITVNIININ